MIMTLYNGHEFIESDITQYSFFVEEDSENEFFFSFGFKYIGGVLYGIIEEEATGEDIFIEYEPTQIFLGSIDRRDSDPYKIISKANQILMSQINSLEYQIFDIFSIGNTAFEEITGKNSDELWLNFNFNAGQK